MLVDHPDPEVDGVVRVADVHLRTADENFALIGGIQAVEDVHQGGLAGAVLPQDGQNFTLVEGQVNVVIGQHTRGRIS